MTNEDVMRYVVKSIKFIRKQKKISQMELCLRAGMSQGFLTDIETGKKEPSTMTLIRIANALEISPREFFPETNVVAHSDVRTKIKSEIIDLVNSL